MAASIEFQTSTIEVVESKSDLHKCASAGGMGPDTAKDDGGVSASAGSATFLAMTTALAADATTTGRRDASGGEVGVGVEVDGWKVDGAVRPSAAFANDP